MFPLEDEILTKKYDLTKGDKPEDLFLKAVGLKIDSLNKLSSEIYADFDEKSLGVKWWKAYQDLGTKRRIFISDYLFMSLQSININLIDARLHLHEFDKNWEKENQLLQKEYENSGFEKIVSKRECALDDLSRYISEMNIVGYVRAIGSVFDCLAASVIGVVGLDLNIKRADFKKVMSYLQKSQDDLELKLLDVINQSLRDSGPEGWLVWVIDLRNMYVHRARRTVMSQVVQEE